MSDSAEHPEPQRVSEEVRAAEPLARLDAELEELDRALTQEPDNVSLLCARAALLLSGGLRYEQAESDLRRASKLDDGNAEVLTNLGILFCKRGRWREAVEPLRRAAEMDHPSRAAAHYYLGDAFNHMDELRDALAAYEAAVRLQPGHWRALKGVGIVLDRMGRPNEAAVAYQRAREAQQR
jgi:Flp pilus assembly protein TadD